MLYIRQDIHLKISRNLEEVSAELNFCRRKWLVRCSFNLQKSNITKHLDVLWRNLDLYSTSRYENSLILGDFSSVTPENAIIEFCKVYRLKNLVKSATCYKNPAKHSCIDLILINIPICFQGRHIIETGLSDFHKWQFENAFSKARPKSYAIQGL